MCTCLAVWLVYHPPTVLPPLGAEFIHLLASEASEISEQQQKKVISAEHVIDALKALGFQEYIEDVQAVHQEYKEQASVSFRCVGIVQFCTCDGGEYVNVCVCVRVIIVRLLCVNFRSTGSARREGGNWTSLGSLKRSCSDNSSSSLRRLVSNS